MLNELGFDTNFIEVGGRKVAYSQISPPNPRGTITLLTGLGSKRFGWYKQFKEFGKLYRTIAIDNRDAGDSDAAAGNYTTADQADDAAAVLRAIGVEKTHLIGISMGGFMSLQTVLRHPDLIEKLVLVATSAGGAGWTRPHWSVIPGYLWATMAQSRNPAERARTIYKTITARGFAAQNSAELDIIAQIAEYRPMNRAAYNRQVNACQTHDVAARLNQIDKPTLIIHGENDALVPLSNGRFLAKRIKNAEFIIYPNTGHIPIIERTAEFNRDVLRFLE